MNEVAFIDFLHQTLKEKPSLYLINMFARKQCVFTFRVKGVYQDVLSLIYKIVAHSGEIAIKKIDIMQDQYSGEIADIHLSLLGCSK